MVESRAAIRYAKAVLHLAKDNNTDETINAEMKQIVNTFNKSEELKAVLANPIIAPEDKKKVLTTIFKNLTKDTLNLITILIANKRIELLVEVANKYTYLYDQIKDTQIAKVTSATPLTKELEEKILAKIKALTGKTAQIENTVNKSILGGFILRIGDLQYDASIANKLNNLKKGFTLNT